MATAEENSRLSSLAPSDSASSDPVLISYPFLAISEIPFSAMPCSIKPFHMYIIPDWKQGLIKDLMDKVWQQESELTANPAPMLWVVVVKLEKSPQCSHNMWTVLHLLRNYMSMSRAVIKKKKKNWEHDMKCSNRCDGLKKIKGTWNETQSWRCTFNSCSSSRFPWNNWNFSL